jgi:hypothetical protein
VIGELDKLAVWDTYNGNDQIYTANGQVCTLNTLVILSFVLHIVICLFGIFFMFLKPQRTLPSFIALLPIIMFF